MLGVILIGKSNSGKSSIGRDTAVKLDMEYISSGDIARNMTDIQELLNQGQLAPENIMRDRIFQAIRNCDKNFILDGFPRFLDQYEWLNQSIDDIDFIYVIIEASDEDILYRAEQRGRCDDTSIREKLEWFKTYTDPMVEEITRNETVHYIKNGNDQHIYDGIVELISIICREAEH